MRPFNSHHLIELLEQDINLMLNQVKYLQTLGNTALNARPTPGKWNIAQIIEHLNSYNRYYIPAIEKTLTHGREESVKYNPVFKTGLFGNYFTNTMQPKVDGTTALKMKSPKDHQPGQKLDSQQVLNEFVHQQTRLLSLLNEAKNTDLAKLKIPISISRFIKLKLGDTFRFLIAHQIRHIIQVNNILKIYSYKNLLTIT